VVGDHLDADRLAGLVTIGCDEISYCRGQRYLTQVCDATGAIVWAKPGRNAQTLQDFFDELGDHKASIRAVSIDMNGGYEKAIRAAVPDAQICFDPFHVVQLSRSKLKPFVNLARTLRARRDGVLAAIRLALSNGRMEGLNSKVRLLSHRSFGFHGPAPLNALIYLCCSQLTIQPPLR
jgi:transposase